MPIVGAGHRWTVTKKRRDDIIKMFMEQHTIDTIALHYGITRQTLTRKLKDEGIDSKALRNAGKQSLRQALFNTIMMIPDEDKKVKAGLDYLNRYPIQDDDDTPTLADDTKSDDAIRLQIISELSGGPFVGSNTDTEDTEDTEH